MGSIWLQLGFEHILDPNGYDHILYLVTLCTLYGIRDWRRVLLLVTAFTIGHSISLVLNVYDIVTVASRFVEKLIPITIIVTAIYNIVSDIKLYKSYKLSYVLAIGFGLIHGMGISNYLKALMSPGDSLTETLFVFNVGVELAQIIVVIIALLVNNVIVDLLNIKSRVWTRLVSIIAILICLYLLFW